VVHPSKAAVFSHAHKPNRWENCKILEGVYCGSECLILAYLRGWPAERVSRKL